MADPRIAAASRVGLRPSYDGAVKCFTCEGGGDGRMLHRMKHNGALRHLCSSCILFYNRGVYCSICYQVYKSASELVDPALWITCCKCLLLSHVNCVRKRSSSLDNLPSICLDCSSHSNTLQQASTSYTASDNIERSSKQTEFHVEVIEPCNKKLCTSYATDDSSKELRVESQHTSSLFDHKTMAAAKVVASLAAKEATDAKARSLLKARVAAKAANRAKSALDAAYRGAREEIKSTVEGGRQPLTNVLGEKVIEAKKHENAEAYDQAAQMTQPIQQRRT